MPDGFRKHGNETGGPIHQRGTSKMEGEILAPSGDGMKPTVGPVGSAVGGGDTVGVLVEPPVVISGTPNLIETGVVWIRQEVAAFDARAEANGVVGVVIILEQFEPVALRVIDRSGRMPTQMADFIAGVRDGDLPDVAHADGCAGDLPAMVERRKQRGDDDGDDGHHRQ